MVTNSLGGEPWPGFCLWDLLTFFGNFTSIVRRLCVVQHTIATYYQDTLTSVMQRRNLPQQHLPITVERAQQQPQGQQLQSKLVISAFSLASHVTAATLVVRISSSFFDIHIFPDRYYPSLPPPHVPVCAYTHSPSNKQTAKCVQRKCRCTYVKFHRQTAPQGPGHPPPSALPPHHPHAHHARTSSTSTSASAASSSRIPDDFVLAPPPGTANLSAIYSQNQHGHLAHQYTSADFAPYGSYAQRESPTSGLTGPGTTRDPSSGLVKEGLRT